MADIRNKRQEEFKEIYLKSGKNGILYLSPRFGKCHVGIKIFKELGDSAKILIAYPDENIKNSWADAFNKEEYSNPNITFTTHLSLKKYLKEDFSLICIDECHLLSPAQLEIVSTLLDNNRILGLTGTLNEYTKKDLGDIGLNVLAEYSLEQAISEGFIADYKITIVTIPLDNNIKYCGKKKNKTEKGQFNSISWVIDNKPMNLKSLFSLRLARMRIIQNSIAKLNLTKKLLIQFKEERVLVFTGNIKIADSLDIPSYHSKSSEQQLFDDFVTGKGNHLAVCKLGNSGITYTPLNKVIFGNFDSNEEGFIQKMNRAMSFEYKEKIANIYIICSTEEVEIKWLKKATNSLNKSKILWKTI